MPEISVIMGVYNQLNRDELFSSVESILNQTFQDFEFIIYDDGSKPEATKMLKEVEKLDPRIVLIGKDKNHGLAFSLNQCIKVAKGKYIARMDADDISYPTRFEKQKAFLDANPDISWVGCNMELFDNNGVWGKRNHPAFPTEKDFLAHSPYPHPTVMYRAEIFDKYRGYNVSDEFLRCEDYELFMRFTKQGMKGANLQEYLFCYREDMVTYNRRNKTARINEMKCRYRGFKEMGILFPFGWFYVLRPLLANLIPRGMIAKIKHLESYLLTAVAVTVMLTQFTGCGMPTEQIKVEGNIDGISHSITGYEELATVKSVTSGIQSEPRVLSTGVRVRNQAKEDASVIGELGRNDSIRFIQNSDDGDWAEIIYNGRLAYVPADAVSETAGRVNNNQQQNNRPTTTTTVAQRVNNTTTTTTQVAQTTTTTVKQDETTQPTEPTNEVVTTNESNEDPT